MNQTLEKKICEHCEGTGIVVKIEWVGDDESYDVEYPCVHQEE
jgi:Ribonuclease G/E